MATDLIERSPFPDFAELRHRVDQMFRDLGDGVGHGWTPSIDVVRREDAIVLRADIPGIKPDDVKITVEDNLLTVSGEHEESSTEEEGDYVRRERHLGSFSRTMSLPRGIKADDIAATTEDGVLEVTIPLPEDEKKQPVEIKPTPKVG